MAKRIAYIENHLWELHISAKARDKYDLGDTLFSNDGKLVFGNFYAVRLLAHKMNKTRAETEHVYPGELNAAGLLDEAGHFILRAYEKELGQAVPDNALAWLDKRLGPKTRNRALLDFITAFPPMSVYRDRESPSDYLQGMTAARSHPAIALEELLMLSLSGMNPANHKLDELLHPGALSDKTLFEKLVVELEAFFLRQPGFGPDRLDVVTFLKSPFLVNPDDIMAQLDYVLQHWKAWLPESMVRQIKKGKDLIREDVRMEAGDGKRHGPTLVPDYKGKGGGQDARLGKSGYRYAEEAVRAYEEYERFTPDTHWMPKVVLLAKNTYVWLDQLSKKYGRHIGSLDQVPDRELDLMAEQGFNGLWLIGIWERSHASRRIKHMTGNPDAVSSAYSLYDYEIAGDLGGESAYHDLNHRARERGIRLASDMVPNHTGLFSKWMVEHPDFFIQARVPPFPAYRFTGENLSDHPDIEIRIEDGYYARTDAAVVFQRHDRRYDDLRYIYHGNDGTNMPWNDTAQLDMLKHEVRQAVIEKIMDVARRFSIIRFDAAMTLAKKHFARLWYPQPGSGGDIPSRADYAMTRQEFDAFFPTEFWREVVDRMNREMPETLLLAEAFWLMEGYFVRTLGMHRVYNSAFMHMMKNEENAKYRDLISNTLEFEPEILKRYVNFMSNPDEETAIRQFGAGDKYFGVCIMMATLPGLPMFAHGQIEGYTEKYGMEYQRAYYNETPDQNLVDRHRREVFPLLKKRQLFSEVEHFHLYDFMDHAGHVNEEVFAFSNRSRDEAALVLFNNKYERAEGRVRESCPKLNKSQGARQAVTSSLGSALGLRDAENVYYVFREEIGGLEYIRSGGEIYRDGFHWALNGFEYRVFTGFQPASHDPGLMEKLHARLGGRGTSALDREIGELKLKDTLDAFSGIFVKTTLDDDAISSFTDAFRRFAAQAAADLSALEPDDLPEQGTGNFPLQVDADMAVRMFQADLHAVRKSLIFIPPEPENPQEPGLQEILAISPQESDGERMTILVASLAIRAFEQALSVQHASANMIDAFGLHWPLQQILGRSGKGEAAVARYIMLVRILVRYGGAVYGHDPATDMVRQENGKHVPGKADPDDSDRDGLVRDMLKDPLVKEFLGVNQYQGNWYYSKEHFEEIQSWLFTLGHGKHFLGTTEASADTSGSSAPSGDFATTDERTAKEIRHNIKRFLRFTRLSGQSGYLLDRLSSSLR